MISYNWYEVEQGVGFISASVLIDLASNARKIRSVLGVYRGGVIPGMMVAYKIGVPFIPLPWQTRDQDKNVDGTVLFDALIACEPYESLVIVDDIADSGRTINEIYRAVEEFNRHSDVPTIVYYSALVRKSSAVLDTPIISVSNFNTTEWVEFPWERPLIPK